MITIFTPTYNRAYIIDKLYESLCSQSCKDFEWLIVDDGSSDETELLIDSFVKENRIVIRYIKQKNSGKHIAINRGLELARGELFFIVDSDDHLSFDAVEKLIYYYQQIALDDSFVGVSGVRVTFEGVRIGGMFNYETLDCSSLDLRLKYNIGGDMAEAFKTAILKQYPFPVFEKERFCPEALIWNRLSMNYKIRFTKEKIYKCEYRADGLTAKIVKLRMNSPLASMLYYSELYKMPIPFDQKLKAAINYWRFALCSKEKFADKVKQIGWVSLLLFPLGLLFHLKDLRS